MKKFFPSLTQWWEVRKGQIRVFYKKNTCYSTANVGRAVEKLEAEMREL